MKWIEANCAICHACKVSIEIFNGSTMIHLIRWPSKKILQLFMQSNHRCVISHRNHCACVCIEFTLDGNSLRHRPLGTAQTNHYLRKYYTLCWQINFKFKFTVWVFKLEFFLSLRVVYLFNNLSWLYDKNN